MKTVGAVACDDVEVLRAEMHAYSIVAADGRRIIESIVSDADQGSASSVDPRVAESRGGIAGLARDLVVCWCVVGRYF